MKSILLDKIQKKYKTFTKISQRMKEHNYLKLRKGGYVALFTLGKIPNLLKDLEYTYDDFMIDYKEVASKYKETKLLFQIWSKGYSIGEYATLNGVSYGGIEKRLKKGFDNSGYFMLDAIAPLAFDSFNEDDIKDLTLELKDNYCKLIGDFDKLTKVKSKYHIKYPVLPYSKSSSHIAFDGVFYTFLKNYKPK